MTDQKTHGTLAALRSNGGLCVIGGLYVETEIIASAYCSDSRVGDSRSMLVFGDNKRKTCQEIDWLGNQNIAIA